jgi:hypothetical protein
MSTNNSKNQNKNNDNNEKNNNLKNNNSENNNLKNNNSNKRRPNHREDAANGREKKRIRRQCLAITNQQQQCGRYRSKNPNHDPMLCHMHNKCPPTQRLPRNPCRTVLIQEAADGKWIDQGGNIWNKAQDRIVME